MKVNNVKYICPKCRKEYDHYIVYSHNSHMSPEKFLSKNITHCPKCKKKLIDEYLIHFFDEKGKFNYEAKQIELEKNKEFSVYQDIVNEIEKIRACINVSEIKLEGILENILKEGVTKERLKKEFIEYPSDIHNHILIKLKAGRKDYLIYDLQLAKVDYAKIGDRWNAFYVDYHTNLNNLILNFLQKSLNSQIKIKVIKKQKVKFEKSLLDYTNHI